jgi:hypothetical protein
VDGTLFWIYSYFMVQVQLFIGIGWFVGWKHIFLGAEILSLWLRFLLVEKLCHSPQQCGPRLNAQDVGD